MMTDKPHPMSNVVTHQRFNARQKEETAKTAFKPKGERDMDDIEAVESLMLWMEVEQRLRLLQRRHGPAFVMDKINEFLGRV